MTAMHGRNASRMRSVTVVVDAADDAIALSAILDHDSHLFMRFILYSIFNELSFN